MKHAHTLSAFSALHTLGQHLQSAVFPRLCLLCAAPGSMLCAPCKSQAQAQLHAACRQCGVPLHTSHFTGICGACINKPPAFDATIAAAIYAPPFDQLILGLKFHAQIAYAPLFADLLAEQIIQRRLCLPDVLIPVPLNHVRLSERGFNQSLEIARPLAKHLGVRLDGETAMRVINTLPQSSLKHVERHKNILGAFAAAAEIKGLRVGVVDDVMTTGATLNELARTLKKAGAAEIINLIVTRAIHSR